MSPAELVRFPQRWRLGVCKACRRSLMTEDGVVTVCPYGGCGAIGRIEWQWVDLAVSFEPVDDAVPSG